MNEEDYVDIDIDNIDDPGEAVPDGIYKVKVDSVEKKHKPGSEYPYLSVQMHPEDGEHNKHKLFLNLSFHPSALWNLKGFVLQAGVPWPKGKGFYYKDLIGKTLSVTVGVKPHYQDENRKVNEVGPPYAKA